MKPGGCLRVAFLLLLAGARCGWTLVCGGQATRPAQGHLSSKGHLHALAIFARFQDEDQGDRALPEFAASLFDPQRPGSLTHFYLEMSQGQLRLDGEVAPHWYGSRRPGAAYVDSTGLSVALSVAKFERWYDHKYGDIRAHQQWMKVTRHLRHQNADRHRRRGQSRHRQRLALPPAAGRQDGAGVSRG